MVVCDSSYESERTLCNRLRDGCSSQVKLNCETFAQYALSEMTPSKGLTLSKVTPETFIVYMNVTAAVCEGWMEISSLLMRGPLWRGPKARFMLVLNEK